jgi:hypothetical protein
MQRCPTQSCRTAVRATPVGVQDDVPLGVDANDEAPLVLVDLDLSKEALDGATRGRDHGPDHGAVHHYDVGVVGYRPWRRHCVCWCLICGLLHDLFFLLRENPFEISRFGRGFVHLLGYKEAGYNPSRVRCREL